MEVRARIFMRGQVWIVKEPESVTEWKVQSGNVLGKTRPYVIMTANEAIDESSVLMGFPISTKLDSPISSSEDDVIMVADNQNIVRVVTSQPTTFDRNQCVNFMYRVPSHVMKALENALLKRSGIQSSISSVKSSIEEMKENIRDGMSAKEILGMLDKLSQHAQSFLVTGDKTGLGRGLLNIPKEETEESVSEELTESESVKVEDNVEIPEESSEEPESNDETEITVNEDTTKVKEETPKEEPKPYIPPEPIKVSQKPSKKTTRYVIDGDTTNLKVDDQYVMGLVDKFKDEDLSPLERAAKRSTEILGHELRRPSIIRGKKTWGNDAMEDFLKIREGMSVGDMAILYHMSPRDIERCTKHCKSRLGKEDSGS